MQSIINISVCTGLFPTKGISLPFISYGGSSLLILSIAISIVIRVSYENKYNHESYKNETKKIHISAAGSGGHIVPAIEIANQLVSRNYLVYLLTTDEKRAEAFISNNKLNMIKFSIKPYKYNSLYTLVTTIFSLSISTIKTIVFFMGNRPDLLVITGGYLSMPLFLSSNIEIPYVVYEQNSVLGKANRIISKFAKKVFTGFEFKLNQNHKNKFIFTGNIIRDELKRKYK